MNWRLPSWEGQPFKAGLFRNGHLMSVVRGFQTASGIYGMSCHMASYDSGTLTQELRPCHRTPRNIISPDAASSRLHSWASISIPRVFQPTSIHIPILTESDHFPTLCYVPSSAIPSRLSLSEAHTIMPPWQRAIIHIGNLIHVLIVCHKPPQFCSATNISRTRRRNTEHSKRAGPIPLLSIGPVQPSHSHESKFASKHTLCQLEKWKQCCALNAELNCWLKVAACSLHITPLRRLISRPGNSNVYDVVGPSEASQRNWAAQATRRVYLRCCSWCAWDIFCAYFSKKSHL